MRRAALLALLACAPAAAQEKPLSLDALYDPASRVDFTGTAPRTLAWLGEDRLHWAKTDPRTRLTEHIVIDARSGARTPLFSADALEAALALLPGVTAADARERAREKKYVLDPQGRLLVLEAGGDLHVFTFAGARLARLTTATGTEE